MRASDFSFYRRVEPSGLRKRWTPGVFNYLSLLLPGQLDGGVPSIIVLATVEFTVQITVYSFCLVHFLHVIFSGYIREYIREQLNAEVSPLGSLA